MRTYEITARSDGEIQVIVTRRNRRVGTWMRFAGRDWYILAVSFLRQDHHP